MSSNEHDEDENSNAQNTRTSSETNPELVNQVFSMLRDTQRRNSKQKRKNFRINRIVDNKEDTEKIVQLASEARRLIKKRQKLIKRADKNKDGRLVVEEYESDDIASDTDDAKRLKKAKSAVEKRCKSNTQGKDRKRFKSDDSQFFRGEQILN